MIHKGIYHFVYPRLHLAELGFRYRGRNKIVQSGSFRFNFLKLHISAYQQTTKYFLCRMFLMH